MSTIMSLFARVILEYLAYPFSTSTRMHRDNVWWAKHLVVLVWAIMFFGKSHHRIEPSKLRSIAVEGLALEVEKQDGVQLPKTFLGFPRCKAFTIENHARYSLEIEVLHSRIIAPSKTMVLSANTVRSKERPQKDKHDASTGSVIVRSSASSPPQSEIFSATESRRLMLSSSSPTPTRTTVANSTTTCTTVSSSSTSSSSSENVPISRMTLPPRPADSIATATGPTSCNEAAATPPSELYFSHYWDMNQGNHLEVEELSQTISISSNEQDEFSREDQDINAEWYGSPGRMAEGDPSVIGNGIRALGDGPALAVGYLGDIVNNLPLNDPNIFLLATNGNPVMMNGIDSNYGGVPTAEIDDLTDDWTQIDTHRYNLVEVPYPREISDQRTREWLQSNPSFPLRPEGRAQRRDDIAMQVASIDDILFESNNDEARDEGQI